MTSELHLLLLEDHAADAELVQRELRREGIQFRATRVWTEADFLAGLRDPALDLILADYSLPAYDGLSALQVARKERPEVPFIFVSGSLGEENAIDALHHGATDYVLKQRLHRVGVAVRRALRDVEAARAQRETLAALRDSEMRFRAVWEHSVDGMRLTDPEGILVAVNEAYCQLAQMPREELEGRPFTVLYRTEQRHADMLRHYRERFARGEIPPREERRMTFKSGQVLDLDISNSYLELRSGQMRLLTLFRNVTERKQAERTLAHERNLLQTLIDNVPDYIWVKDAQCRFVLNNRAHRTLLKAATQAEVTGKMDRDVFSAELAAQYYADEQAVFQSGQPLVNREESTVDPAGRIRWLLTTKVPLRDEQGGITRLVGVSRDITERKRAEHRTAAFATLGYRLNTATTPREAADIILQAADELFGWDACALDVYSAETDTVHAVVRMDILEGRRVEVPASFSDSAPSPRARRTLQSGAQLILRGLQPEFSPDSPPFGDTSRPSASIMLVPARHGDHITGLLSIQSYRPNAYTEEDLQCLQALADHCGGALQRLRAEEKTRAQAHLLDLAQDAIVVRDLEHRVLYWNRGAVKLYGWTPEEAVGRSVAELIGRDPQSLESDLQELLRTGQWAGELRLHTKDQREVFVSSRWTLMRDDQGRPKSVLVINTDITEKKKLETQFLRAQRLDSIGQLAGGVAHDFNNILAAIIIQLQLLEDSPHLHPEIAAALKEIEKGANMAASLTRQLLLFSRRQTMQIRNLDLNDVVDGLLKMLRRILGEHVEMAWHRAGKPMSVEADAGMLEQVLMNLCVNARDAMPKGGRLTLQTQLAEIAPAEAATQPEARAGSFVCLSVADTGCGMNEAVLKQIFEPFFTTKEAGQGTGLGLATVYGIVKQHQGWVSVESAVGRGTTFRVYLPSAEPANAGPAPAEEPSPRGTETIFVVEDDDLVRRTVAASLGRLGYVVLEARHGLEALQRWEECAGRVDLLLTDMVMPKGMTGLELADHLRAQKPELKVIISSGYSADLVHLGPEALQSFRFLAKPYSPKTMARCVRDCLDGKAAP
ncbi:MAG: PAS domain S-box protein [Verrucomicrobia bacterium]|nr:PAS domain S-box protein [Verrucomicrobiota bacterium]